MVATGASVAVHDPQRLLEVCCRTLGRHRHFQQIADQRHAISAFDVGLAPSASESTPKSSSPRDFELELGSIPVGAIAETGTAWGAPAAGSLPFYFCQLILHVSLLVFLLVSAAIDVKNYFEFKWLLG
jgi:hypothetical protein